ncbi:MAG: SPOR domain-containing protein [Pseudomonadota bacterium]
MTMKRAALTALAVVFLSAGLAPAQQLRDALNPAEFPPDTFTGNQYVDSRGCVYIRAGISGRTTWVPRVTRDRRLVCGFQPSLPNVVASADPSSGQSNTAGTSRVAPTAPSGSAQSGTVVFPTRPKVATRPVTEPNVTPVTRPKVAQATPSTPSTPSTTTQSGVTQRTAPKVAAAPSNTGSGVVSTGCNGKVVRPTTTGTTTTAAKAAPKPTKRMTKTTTRAVAKTRTGKIGSVKTANSFQRPKVVPPNMVAGNSPAQKAPTNLIPTNAQNAAIAPDPACGSATTFSKRYINSQGKLAVRCGPQSESPVTVKSTQRVALAAAKPVAPASTVTNAQIEQYALPKGYVSIWDDDRLNPYRGPRTLQGDQQMRLVWTDEVPRRLIDQVTGADVTALNPNLRYPYTNLATQQRKVAKASTIRRKTVVSTKSTPRRVVASVPKSISVNRSSAAKPYVQVGLFGVPSNAAKAAARLEARGIPAKTKRTTRGGKVYQIVYSGPYKDTASVGQALRLAKSAGFSDAFLRR